ncbi:MAG: hypothetical protein HY000_39610 [Planctomycetes bacterium]|nr:hypothetical protein [Planctomycetota bacterium]
MPQLLTALTLMLILSTPVLAADSQAARLRGALLTAAMASPSRLTELRAQGYNAIVLTVNDDSPLGRQADRDAAGRVTQAGLDLWYWIEVGRSPQLADAHPQWMASLQGHPEWRRYFKDFPAAKTGEVVKNYPWVPILYRETFDAHLTRFAKLLSARPAPEGVLLNDLQGPPSACGCGNPVCRWTADYGPIKTATPLEDDAAARFIAAAEKLVGDGVPVVPIWTTECESHDVAKDALCAGVGCYKGICWKAYSRQLRHVAEHSPVIGALLLYKEFGQDTPTFSQRAGWVGHALRSFQIMPPENGGQAVEPQRLLAVLQGWDVSTDDLAAQQKQAEMAGASGWVVAFSRIDQSWSPRIVAVR